MEHDPHTPVGICACCLQWLIHDFDLCVCVWGGGGGISVIVWQHRLLRTQVRHTDNGA